MKTKRRKTLPKTVDEITNGGVYLQRVRCGKRNCKCARGDTHTAYYFFTRHNGKLIKMYVRKREAKAFARLANQAAIERAQKRLSAKQSTELLKRLRESGQEYERLIKLTKENYLNEQRQT